MNNINYINGKQYPFGYKQWLRSISILLEIDNSYDAHLKLCPDAWLHFFMDGLSPHMAVKEDLKNL